MTNFTGGVAVITGAANGIGLALAHEALHRGMKLVLADIREDALEQAAQALAASGGEVLAVRTDATRREDIEALAAAAIARFGRVNLLVNNAGAFVAGLAWDTPAEQYDWLVDLNLKSVMHGIRAFVPRMIAQGDACHVITIASGAAITVYPGYAAYSSTKHAVLAMTEALYCDLVAERIGNIGVTIAMPGMVRTGIMAPEKASPAALNLGSAARWENATVRAVEQMMLRRLPIGLPPEALAQQVFDAAAADRLYVLPAHDDEAIQAVAKSIGIGRAIGNNAFPPVLDGILKSMAKGAPET